MKSFRNYVRACVPLLMTVLVGCGAITSPASKPQDESQIETQVKDGVANGLTGRYYNNSNFTEQIISKVDNTISNSWGDKKPAKGVDPTSYSVRWTGQIIAPYSERYTFFLTSSGSARLFVNGQPIAIDWVNHGTRMVSGAIDLRAGVKYDIRLEMKREQNDPGTVILEWESPSQKRQVVPQRNLLSVGSNADTAIRTLEKNSNYATYTLDISSDNTRAFIGSDGAINILAAPSNAKGFILASTAFDQVNMALYLFEKNGDLYINDLVDGRKIELGKSTNYFTPGGANNDNLMRPLMAKIAAFISNGLYKESDLQAQNKSILHTQAIIIPPVCKGMLPPPPKCQGDVCEGAAESYRDSICSELGVIEDAMFAIIFPPAGAIDTLITVGSLIPGDYHPAMWQKYIDCIIKHKYPVDRGSTGQPEGCAVGILVEAGNPSVKDRVGHSGLIRVTISNVTNDPKWPANATLDALVHFTTASQNISTTFEGETFKILPNMSNGFDIGYTCPLIPTTLSASVTVLHNANFRIKDSFSVSIDCEDTPEGLKVSVDDDVLYGGYDLLNGTFIHDETYIRVSNLDNFETEYFLDTPPDTFAFFEIDPADLSGVIPANSTKSIRVKSKCDTETRKHVLNFSINGKYNDVELKCFTNFISAAVKIVKQGSIYASVSASTSYGSSITFGTLISDTPQDFYEALQYGMGLADEKLGVPSSGWMDCTESTNGIFDRCKYVYLDGYMNYEMNR